MRRVPYAMPVKANIFQTFPNLAAAVSITAAGPPGSAWVQIFTAAQAPASPFVVLGVHLDLTDISMIRTAFEIGAGGAGSEVAKAVAFGSNGPGLFCPEPLIVHPGGTRIAVRAIGTDASVCKVKLVTQLAPPSLSPGAALARARKWGTFYPGVPSFTSPAALAANNGAAWVYPAAYTELLATMNSVPHLLTGFLHLGNVQASAAQAAFTYGAAGSEVVFAEFPQAHALTIYAPHHIPFAFPILMPASWRWAGKAADEDSVAWNTFLYEQWQVVLLPYYP